MTIDPITAVWIVRLALAVAFAFSAGVVFGDVTRRRPRKRPRKRKRLRTHYLRGDDGSIFRVRCQPGAFRRLLAKIEDEECCGE